MRQKAIFTRPYTLRRTWERNIGLDFGIGVWGLAIPGNSHGCRQPNRASSVVFDRALGADDRLMAGALPCREAVSIGNDSPMPIPQRARAWTNAARSSRRARSDPSSNVGIRAEQVAGGSNLAAQPLDIFTCATDEAIDALPEPWLSSTVSGGTG